jgi:hypothetical protein
LLSRHSPAGKSQIRQFPKKPRQHFSPFSNAKQTKNPAKIAGVFSLEVDEKAIYRAENLNTVTV